MPKVDLELVKLVLQRNELDIRLVSQIVEDINGEVAAMDDEEEKVPPVKKQFVILVSDPHGELPDKDFVGWVLQVPEEDTWVDAVQRLERSAYEFNTSKKGRRMPIRTIAEACEHLSGKFTAEQRVWIKTKEPVYVLRTGGKIPMSEISGLRKRNADQADEGGQS